MENANVFEVNIQKFFKGKIQKFFEWKIGFALVLGALVLDFWCTDILSMLISSFPWCPFPVSKESTFKSGPCVLGVPWTRFDQKHAMPGF